MFEIIDTNFPDTNRLQNPYNNIPVEIIRLVADSADDPQDNAALALCNQDMESILSTDFTTPEVTAYVAVCSFERNLILRVIRKNGGGSMTRGLTHEIYDRQYALDILGDANRTDLFQLLEQFLTPGHVSILAAYKGAVAFRNKELMDMLLPILNEMAVDALPYTCLYANGNPEISAALLPYIPDDLRADACTSEVENAVTSGRVGILQVLIYGGASVNIVFTEEENDSDERTAMHWVAKNGLWHNESKGCFNDMVRMLVTAGANLDAIDYKGRTPLHEFALNGSRAVTPTLEYEDDITNKCPAWVYALVLRFIVAAGADLNVQDDDGMTPLHLAVSRRETVMIEILLRNGVNAMITNNNGIRASMVNGEGMVVDTIDFQVWKYEAEQLERTDPKWISVL